MESIYESVPLDTGISTNIRLVEILDASNNESDPISCKLHVVPLSQENPITYTALSYMWGSPDYTETILLNGKPFLVRKNLVNFLHQARPRRPGFLWIDALCIDQSSVIERNHQVMLMKNIYSSAEKVIVWLGPMPAELSSELGRLPRTANETDFSSWRSCRRSVIHICAQNYWLRIWIIQEYVLAQRIDIWCGAATLNGELLEQILMSVLKSMELVSLKNLLSVDPEVELYHSSAMQVVRLRQERLTIGLNWGLDGLLGRFWHLQCADVRDRIYALLSLVSTGRLEQLRIVPDYSKSSLEVFQDVHRAFLRCHTYQRLVKDDARRLVLRLSFTLRLPHDRVTRKRLDKALEESTLIKT